nr:MAG TPA: Protein of unknown function (DUF4050) [Caudoviricetes sp.]
MAVKRKRQALNGEEMKWNRREKNAKELLRKVLKRGAVQRQISE